MKNLGIQIRAVAGTILLEIFNEMEYWQNMEDYLRWQIKEHGVTAPMEVRINSIGGDPRVGLALYKVIKSHQGPTTAYIEYICDSSATLPACACDEVIGNEFPFEYMIHDPNIHPGWVGVEDGEVAIEYLRGVRDDFVRIYHEKTGQSEEDIRAWMKATKFMKAEEALELGFIDRIEEVDESLNEIVDYKIAASAYERPQNFKIEGRNSSPTEPQKPNKPKSTMDILAKLRATFGFGEDRDETDVVIEAKELKAKADKLEQLEKDLETERAEVIKLKAELEKYKEEEPTEEELADQAEQQVEAELQAAVKDFKITASVVDQYKSTYAGKPAELKAALSLIPEGAAKPSGGAPSSPKTRASANGVHPKVAAAFGK